MIQIISLLYIISSLIVISSSFLEDYLVGPLHEAILKI